MGMYLASPWPRQDLFFLNDALRHGGSFAEIASFLCRDEDEVREKAKELKLIGPASVWPFDHDGGADHVGRSPLTSSRLLKMQIGSGLALSTSLKRCRHCLFGSLLSFKRLLRSTWAT
jgi:hypothetical protein